jgi:hypothetical protein
MLVQKRSLLGRWNPGGLIVYHQKYRPNNNGQNVDIKLSAHDAFVE